MRESDFAAFSTMLEDLAAFYPSAKTPTPGHKAMFFRALSAHDIGAVRAAFDAHVKDPQRGRFMPLPADLIAQMQGLAADDGRPGAEEAWAIALRSADERETVVWTQEAAEAWSTAKAVFDVGDEVGARMAFREVYTRLVDAARLQQRAPQWSASLGFDAERRQLALEQAAARGRLSPGESLLRLEAPSSLAIVAAETTVPPAAREALIRLSLHLASRPEQTSADAQAKERTQELKAEAAELVSARIDEAGPCAGVQDLLARALARAEARA